MLTVIILSLILVALGVGLILSGISLWNRPRQKPGLARSLNGGASDDYTPHRNKLLW